MNFQLATATVLARSGMATGSNSTSAAASANGAKPEAPEEFVCPITFEVMRDPVVDPEGNSYERQAISNWVVKHHQSPVTRSPLTVAQLIPNRALKGMIEKWKQKQARCASKLSAALTRDKVCRQKSTDLAKQISAIELGASAGGSARTVAPCQLGITSTHDGRAVVSVVPAAKGGRVPVDVCCVIDVSGSMISNATLKDTSGNTESHGLSILDIAKHSVRTISESLTAADRLSIVAYSTTARLVMSLQKMDAPGKTKAVAAVLNLRASGSTNLWMGLVTGLEDLAKHGSDGRLQTIMLLTDGMPNISPPRGEVAMLKRRRIKQCEEKRIIINTFGFGYNLDTLLLRQLAQEGMGSYAFIPDASLVGTMFVNALANTLVSVGTSAEVTLECINGAKFKPHPANPQLWLQCGCDSMSSVAAVAQLGAVQLGQQKDVYVALQLPEGADPTKQYLKAELSYHHQVPQKMHHVKPTTFKSVKSSSLVEYCWCRLALVTGIFDAIDAFPDLKLANQIIAKTIGDIKASNVARNPRINALLKDLLGQVKEALSRKDWYNKWGKHYLPSLALAHLRQQCNNFKDPGVQCYGGEDFATQRDLADEIFCKLPPPRAGPKPKPKKKTKKATTQYRQFHAHQPAARPAAVNMSHYMNRGGGCFHGDNKVAMADGSHKQLRNVKAGDLLATQKDKPHSRVRCVIKSVQADGVTDLVQLPGSKLLATPWHPVRTGNEWVFPVDVGTTKSVACDAVYNLLLEADCSALIEGWECVTLAHGLSGDVVGHSYYGTEAVIQDLMKMDGWANGFVVLHPDHVATRRDASTSLVTGITAIN